MNYELVLEVGTILSILAIVIPVLAAMGVFKSRRQRDLEAALKRSLRSGSKRPSPPLQTLAAGHSAGAVDILSTRTPVGGSIDAYDHRLRALPKAFDSSKSEAESMDLHSPERMRRRYRRTRCVMRNPSKGACPKCGYLL